MASSVGFGFTVIVKILSVPTQPLSVGVIVTEDTCCVATFAAMKAAISPVPVASVKPVLTLLFVQLNVAFVVPLKVVVEIGSLAQTVMFAGLVTEGVGLMLN